MKIKIIILMIMSFTNMAWSGDDIPWPINSEQQILWGQLGGQWMSQKSGRSSMFQISVEETGYAFCPEMISVYELDSKQREILSFGMGLHCADDVSLKHIMLFSRAGDLKYYVDITGIEDNSQGYPPYGRTQFLGISVYSPWEKQYVYREVFRKISN